ncbi:MAG: hypothetical protein AAF391_08815, partial [Bacteroidota bacterium]
LTLSSIVLDPNTPETSSLNYIRIYLNIPTENIQTGTYVFGNEESSSLFGGFVGPNVSLSSQGLVSGPLAFNAIDGTVTVASSGSTYTIGFNLSGTIDGLAVDANGAYTGTLEAL